MSTNPKLKLYEEFAAIARALGNAHRIDILEHLGQGERGVDALAAKVGLSTANTSQHLQHLKRAGLVDSRREGKYILYRLKDDNVLALLGALFDVGEKNLAEVDKVLRDYFHRSVTRSCWNAAAPGLSPCSMSVRRTNTKWSTCRGRRIFR